MIDIAACAPDGVTIQGRKQTRNKILNTFKSQLTKLRERLNVSLFSHHVHAQILPLSQSKRVPGSVSLTCDAWQANTADGYFAVTGSWIEEVSEGHWEQQSALLGFVRMNSAHNGRRLGTALFKVCNRLDIAHKIGWVTCDNASNNTPMMERFAFMIQQKTGKEFNPIKRRIRYVRLRNLLLFLFLYISFLDVLLILSILRLKHSYQSTQNHCHTTLKSQMKNW